MKLLQKLKGLIVINEIPEEDEELAEEPASEEKKSPVHNGRPPKRQTCWDKYAKVFYVLMICLLIGLVIPIILMGTVFAPKDKVLNQRGYCYINASLKFSCGDNNTEDVCISRGCCYEETNSQPWCYHSEPSEYGYVVEKVNSKSTLSSKTSPLELASLGSKVSDAELSNLTLTSLQKTTPYGGDAWPVNFAIESSGDDIVRITLSSPGNDSGTLISDDTFSPSPGSNSTLKFQVINVNDAFNITVFRTNSKEVLFQTLYGPMVMGDGYMEITTTVPTKNIFGLGSRYSSNVNPLFDEYEKWTLNSKDTSFSERSLPGTHPFYMGIDSNGEAYGVYVRTSAPLQIGTVPAPGLSFRTVMGTFKILIMAGPTPKDVSRQYTSLVKTPPLPPYWALGFHLCRTVAENQPQLVQQVHSDMNSSSLPYESDCLDARLAYPDPFSDVSDGVWSNIIQELHDSDRKFLATSYPFIAEGSSTMDEIRDVPLLLKLSNSSYYGNVSGTAVGYPDYIDERTSTEWLNKSPSVKSAFNVSDGLLLLQNAPTNEAKIQYGSSTDCSVEHLEKCCQRSGFKFQVDPESVEPSEGSICWSVIQPTRNDSSHLAHHNAYGMYHTKRAYLMLENLRPRTRHVVLSSSTHPGSGKFGGHYSEGFTTLLEDQKRALLQVLEMGLAGIPLTGTPPCGSRDGFDIDENEKLWTELCFRSYLNTIFSPFLLSHYELDQRSTNPTDVATGFAAQLKHYMMLRYMLLPTIYTFFKDATESGSPVLRHLFYEFPQDERSLEIGDQFMIGSSILVVPNFVNESNSISTSFVPAYFPPGRWHELLTGRVVSDSDNGTDTALPTTITDLNLFLRGGSVVFMQGKLSDTIRTAEEMRKNPFSVYVSVLNDTDSYGSMYYDDGVTRLEDGNYTATLLEVTAPAMQKELNITSSAGMDGRDLYVDSSGNHSSTIENVILFGVGKVQKVWVNAQAVTPSSLADSVSVPVSRDWTEDNITITWQ